MNCPKCKEDITDNFTLIDQRHGKSHSPGEPTTYWIQGTAECNICGYEFEYEDSGP
jgi:hypothetical protein